MSRKIKILFTLSILLNVFFLGLFAGGISRLYQHFGMGGEFQKELESMSPEVRERIEAAYASSRQEMRTLFMAARHAKQEVRDSLNAEQFDPQDFEVAIGKLNQIRLRMLQTQAKKTGMIASELNADERRKFAGHLLRGPRKAAFSRLQPPSEKTSSAPVQQTQQPVSAQETSSVSGDGTAGQEDPFDPVMLPMPDF